MSYLITTDESGNVNVSTPVPKAALTYEGFKLILDEIPPLPSGHKYIIDNGQLSTAARNSSDNEQIDQDNIRVAFETIEADTKSELDKGFNFDGNKFALDQQSQLHWIRLFQLLQDGSFADQNIPTLDHGVYMLRVAQCSNFFNAYHSKASAILEAERVSKELAVSQITT